MTNLNNIAASAANSNVTSSEVTNLLAQGQQKTAEFCLILSGITLMSDTVTLSSLEDSKLSGVVKDDVSGNRIKVSTKTSIFGEPIARLKGIKKKVEALLSIYGTKAGLDGGYFVPKAVATNCLEELLPLKEEFNKEMERLKTDYSAFLESEKARCLKIEDIDLRAEAMAKLPSFENFSKRCQFKPVVLDWAATAGASDAVNALLADGKAEKSKSIIESYLDKVFSPFFMVKYDFDNNVKNRTDYKAEELGKKRGSIRKACLKALNTKFCMEHVFKEEPEKTLLAKAYALISEISSRFCGKESQKIKPSKELEKTMYDIYLNVLNTMSSKENFEEFLSKGGDIESIFNGFDIQNIGKATKAEALVAIEDALTELKGEAKVEPAPTESKEAEDNSEALEIIDNALSELKGDEVEATDEDFISSLEELANSQPVEVEPSPVTEAEVVHAVQSDAPVQEAQAEETVAAAPSITIDPSMDIEDFYAALGL